ncbi:predicted protein [Sclerotinia sclerotiorum 1980 UF-70]|uniref:Uncharacterized protein n=1 Tax=Sclerotinia sclerotiorum (strain ATCC 18683 / 1980 / Ss-1) TaxID=665079 RepID=A7ES22_SCLS1|nr:predicted protein [Sclerotinia sclerotiorum 1980 UF-70]EDN92264.1 predicted protein [Sclerotinia sclerotiorum 1980 UF-70]
MSMSLSHDPGDSGLIGLSQCVQSYIRTIERAQLNLGLACGNPKSPAMVLKILGQKYLPTLNFENRAGSWGLVRLRFLAKY